MLKKPASGVLASFRPSTYPRGYAFGPPLAAALLDGLFEHPAGVFSYLCHAYGPSKFSRANLVFRSLFNYSPASLRKILALSVFSQVNSGSFRPKCPYDAVFLKIGRRSLR